MEYSAFNTYIGRTPLYSYSVFEEITKSNSLDETINAVFGFFSDIKNQEALFLASPELYKTVVEYHQNKVVFNKEQKRNVGSSLMKYLARMTTRSTPFGMFAGCNTGQIESETNMTLRSSIEDCKHTRLDMNYVCALAKKISIQPEIKEQLKFFPNNSLYKIASRNRYIERKLSGTNVKYHISQVDENHYVSALLEYSRDGKNIVELCNHIISEEVDFAEAREFVMELIENQLLVDELEPVVYGKEFFEVFIEKLQNLEPTTSFTLNENNWTLSNFINELLKIKQYLIIIDKNESNEISSYQLIIEIVKSFGVQYELNRLFQTDLIKKSNGNTLSTKVIREVKSCLRVLNKLSSGSQYETRMEQFAKTFYEKYQDAELPMMQILDTDFGLSYSDSRGSNNSIQLTKVEKYLKDKILESITNGDNTIEILDDEIKDFTENWDNLSDTFTSIVNILEADNDECVLNISNASGPSAANILGRFCHADSEIYNLVRSITQKEEDLKSKETLLAEINHLTESRTGNITSRPVIRQYEIPYLANTTSPNESQLNVADLFLSVRQNKVFLRSHKHNKFIIPKLTNAHNINYGNTQPVYQFLGDLQSHYEKSWIGFSWGKLENFFDFFPRVIYKKHILSRAKWIFSTEQIDDLQEKYRKNQMAGIAKWQQRFNIPNKVFLVQNDNELLINFKNELSVLSLLSAVKNKNNIIIEEFLADKYMIPTKDDKDNLFTNQSLIFFHRNQVNDKRDLMFKSVSSQINSVSLDTKRIFIPGENWVYFKVYLGAKDANEVLVEFLNPLLHNLQQRKLSNQWFFIRYTDPDYHLRIRIKANKNEDVGLIIKYFYDAILPYHQEKIVKKIVIDSYERELERYGFDSIELAEKYFYHNSEFVLQLIQAEIDFSTTQIYCMRYIDRLLSHFGFDLIKKRDLMFLLSEAFGKEFNKGTALSKDLGAKYRELRTKIENCLSTNLENQDFKIIDDASDNCKSIITELITKNQKQQLSVDLFNLIGSYLHMFLNRAFIEKQRYHEMVLYHLLWHHYRSVIARK